MGSTPARSSYQAEKREITKGVMLILAELDGELKVRNGELVVPEGTPPELQEKIRALEPELRWAAGLPTPPGEPWGRAREHFKTLRAGGSMSAAPKALPVVARDIPGDLKELDRWVAWRWEMRDGKWTKVPVRSKSGTRSSSTDPSDWSSFEEAVRCARRELLPGVGFVFTGFPFAGVDLDGCRDPETGEIEPWAAEILDGLDFYAEVSPSGTGVKAFVRATLPPGRKRKGPIEMYDSGRFFTVTGHRLPGSPAGVMARGEQLDALHRRVFGVSADHGRARVRPDDLPGGASLEDDELVRRATTAANGEKFAHLWAGDASEYANGANEGRSEADLALCSLLAFWCGPDEGRIDRLFRQSGLYRPKWDERRGARTYGELTIEYALAGRSEFWSERAATVGVGKVYARRRGAVSVG